MPLPNQDATQVVTNNGLRTQYGLLIPPGAKVAAYVRSTGIGPSPGDGNDAFLVQNLVTTLAAGVARARAGFGDFVVVLPGHVETVSDATTFSGALVAGVKIVGVGRGSTMPTFTFTGAGTWAVNKADVMIAGIRIQSATSGNPGTAITVTGADFGFYNNDVIVGNAGAGFTVNIIQVSAGGDRADISGNTARHTVTGGGSGPFVDIQAVANDIRVSDNELIHGAGAAVGLIRVGAVAAVGLKILRNTLYNTTAVSTVCIQLGAAANDGVAAYNNMGVKNTAGTASAQGITFGAGSLVLSFQNFCTDTAQQSGLLSPVVNT